MKDKTETTLIRAALKGDADSFGRLCERYYSALVAIAYSRLSDRDLAEDAAQEAFYVAFRDISRLKEPNHFGRWLTKICRNISSDMAKAKRRDKFVAVENLELHSNEKTKQDNYDEVVRSIIAKLPFEFREILDKGGELGDAIVFFLKTPKDANRLVKGMQEAGLGTKNIPDAMRWHFAKNWKHIYNRYGWYKDLWQTHWQKSSEILERAVALPIMVKMSDDRIAVRKNEPEWSGRVT